jgi:RimJ/RimL family protein N-acetyltransferase
MVDPKTLLIASLEAGREFLRPPAEREDTEQPRPAPSLVPIRSLGENHRERIAQHLLALTPHDRYLRFGHWTRDEQIQSYADSLDFDRDEIFGIYNRKLELIAVAHLAYAKDQQHDSCAEFGVSVLSSARGRGYGARLFDRAAMHATNDGVSLMFIHALSENAAMLKIARNAGAIVERDGMESEAYLRLPPASFDSRVSEMIEEQIAQTDYRLKSQAKSFWSFLADLQKIRHDTIDANQRSSS